MSTLPSATDARDVGARVTAILETSVAWQILTTSRCYTAVAAALRWLSRQLRHIDERQCAGHGARFATGLREELRAISRVRPTVTALTAGECFYGVVGLVLAAICTYGMWGTKPPRHAFFSPSGVLCADQTHVCDDAPLTISGRAASPTRRSTLTVPQRAPRGHFVYEGLWFTQPVHRVFYSDAGHLCTDQVVLHPNGRRFATCP